MRPGSGGCVGGRQNGNQRLPFVAFREENGNVKLLGVEHFKGPMVWVGYLLSVPKRLHRLTVEFLVTFKNAAEACRS